MSQALKKYLGLHDISQEEIGYQLNLHVKTISRYERGEGGQNIQELRRISDFLGIPPERLGLAAITEIPRSPVEIDAVTQHIWGLTEQALQLLARAYLRTNDISGFERADGIK